jgi:hypothetical protein
MYSAYFDESGTDGSSDSIVVAGYIASNEQWQDFRNEWDAVLQDVGVTRFHMRDFAHSLREFKDWKDDNERRTIFLKRLVSIMRRHTRHSFSTAVILKDYRDLDQRYQLSEYCSPYVISALQCAADVAKWCNARGYVDPVRLVFEDGARYKGEFMNFYAPSNFHTISYAEPREFVGFQAADLVAWEHRKVYSQLLSGQGKRRRQSFLALHSMPNSWSVYEASSLARWCRNFNVPLRGHL